MIFLRSLVLLATLIALPGIAICWNHLPENLWNKPNAKAETPKKETTKSEQVSVSAESLNAEKFDVVSNLNSVFTSESVQVDLPPASLPEIQNSISAIKKTTNTSSQQTVQKSSKTSSTHDFESLERQLKALGAKYYRLEKWGNRGELFRFSCFVAPSERGSYEKHFQAIGADEVSVMQSVLTDIEEWKKQSPR